MAGMQRVVGPDGTGRIVQIKDFPIAGKTGTADFRAHGKKSTWPLLALRCQ